MNGPPIDARSNLLRGTDRGGFASRSGGSRSADRLESYDIHSDCDSEGNEPPTYGEFINPLTLDESAPPPRSAAESRLPLTMPMEQRRMREAFEPPIHYEDWAEDDVALAIHSGKLDAAGSKRDILRLEEDTDFPLGRHYAYHAFCPTCSRSYFPVVPGGWKCLRCNGPVWQQPTDPESKHCAVCHRGVAKNRKLGHLKIQNPLSLNPHVCKRCGRIVCDQCYSPEPTDISEYGFSTPQKVCTECVMDIAEMATLPTEPDIGTLHDENAIMERDDEANMLPYWPPKCVVCCVTAAKPPKRWECEVCRGFMWQPEGVPDSETCWICDAPNPTSRCHRCGQLSCKPCGAFAQPLPEVGFTDGIAVSVCKVCYTGIATSVVPDRYKEYIMEELDGRLLTELRCSQCKAHQGSAIPPQWAASCHRGAKCWETGVTECGLCTTPITEATSHHCYQCGHAVCVTCVQYRCPLPQRGYPKDEGQPICRACFHPRAALQPDHCDTHQWPPYCSVCSKYYDKPPPRWRCVNECGNVWQPIGHIASGTCHGCGGKVNQPVNCRRCGRIVCVSCSKNRTELVEIGFTRGQVFPTCNKCMDWMKQKSGELAEEKATSRSAPTPHVARHSVGVPPPIVSSDPTPIYQPSLSPPIEPQIVQASIPPATGFKGPPPGFKGPPPGFKGPPPGFKGPPPGFKGPPPGFKGPPPAGMSPLPQPQ